MSRIDIRVLGPLQVRIDERLVDLGTRKQRALLALLVSRRGRPVSTDRVIMALWGADGSPDRRNDVWAYVSRLRKALGERADVLERRSDGYVLQTDSETVDAHRFEALSADGRRLLARDPAAASLVLGEALSMWSGEPYGEFSDDDFVVAEAARLDALRLTTLEARIEADLAWRDPVELLPEIEGLVTRFPLRPRLTAALMLALYRRGRQADALRAYRRFSDGLADLGLEPPEELRRLEQQILLDDAAVRTPAPELSPRLPEPIAEFLGRHSELKEVGRLLGRHRLVTLIGPGGVGKTSLALETARRVAVDYDDSVWIDLVGAAGEADVGNRIVSSMRLAAGDDPWASVRRRIGTRRVLLVLDNCETAAADAGVAVTRLLRAAPGLHVLATSRTVLGADGERAVRLHPMSTDVGGDAEQLLLARIDSAAETIDPPTLRRLIRGTAGLPLAVELAAAQLRTFSAADVAAALESSPGALAAPELIGPDHHRDLRASIEWSARLLPEEALVLLARLAVFRPSFGADAAIDVAGFGQLGHGPARATLRRLVETSLVLPVAGEAGRFRLLEPVRQHAADLLMDTGEKAVVEERHARFFLDRFGSAHQRIEHGAEAGLVERLRPDADNLVLALRWVIATGDAEGAARGVVASLPFLRAVGSTHDIVALAEAALAIPSDPTLTRAELTFRAAPLFALARGTPAYRAMLLEMQELSSALEDPEAAAWAALRSADAAALDEPPDEVQRRYEVAIAALRAVDSDHVFRAYHQYGWWLLWQGNRWDEAEKVGAAWWAVSVKLGELAMAAVRTFRSWLAMAVRDPARLETESMLAVELYRRQGDYRMAAAQNGPLAMAAAWRGEYDEALRRIDMTILANEEQGATPWVINARLNRAGINLLRHAPAAAIEELGQIAREAVQRDEPELARAVASVAARALAEDDPQAASVFLGVAAVVPRDNWYPNAQVLVAPVLDEHFGPVDERLAASLGSSPFGEAVAHGRELTDEDVGAVVLDALERARKR